MPEYEFELILEGDAIDHEMADRVYAACDDCTLGSSGGRVDATFDREAPSLKDAIISAIQDVRRAGVRVLRVETCHLVTQAEIARRIGCSRQLVHQYSRGDRGPGRFPFPACEIAEGSPLWNWCEVSYWLWQAGLIREDVASDAQLLDTVNAALDYAHWRQVDPATMDLLLQGA